MTYYEILEISEKASQEVIRMAYKALCKKYHPDIYQGDKNFAEEQMKKINAAYETLSDEIKKGEYDHYLNSQKHYDSTHYEYKRESTQINIEALLKRGFMSLEERRFAEALNFFEQILNQNAEVAEAYLGKLCVDLKVRFPHELSNVAYPFDNNNNFKKAMRFGDEKLKSNLQGYIDAIIQRQLSDAYNNALYTMRNATSEDDFRLAAEKFSAISHYKDSSNLAKTCLKKAEIAYKEQKYIDACNIMSTSTTINSYQKAIAIFESINDWKDSKEKILYCKKKIDDIKVILKEERITKEKAEKERKEQERIALYEAEQKRKKKKKITVSILVSGITLLVFFFVYSNVISPAVENKNAYNEALSLMENGYYKEAISIFEKLDGYKESYKKIDICQKERWYNEGETLYEQGEYLDSINAFKQIINYKDSTQRIEEIFNEYKIHTLKNAKVGDTVYFGTWEPYRGVVDIPVEEEPIEWRVLDYKDGKILVISDSVIEKLFYHNEYVNITWEECSLRKWLNGYFLNSAFSSEEQTLIPTVKVSADGNDSYNTNPGKITNDKVFLLSINEAEKYFEDRYALSCGYEWWLRTPGKRQQRVAYINKAGLIEKDGDDCTAYNLDEICVRPALWIDISEIK